MPGTFSPPQISKETASLRSRHVRDARAVMHVRIANQQWWGKRSRHFRRMRNPQFCLSGKRPIVPHSQGEPVKTATLQNGHNQNGHTEWDHYQNGHTTLVKTATLLWSKRPHRMGSYQNGHVFLVKTATPLWSKRPQGGLYPKWAEVATKTATLHLVKTATNSEWYQFCEEWITAFARHPKTSTISLC